MAYDQRETKDWLREIARHMNLSPSQLALNSGMAASTLTRYLNDNSNSVSITQTSLEKVALYSGFKIGQYPGRTRGLQEPDAVPFAQDADSKPKWLEAAVTAARQDRAGVDAWVMKGSALDGMGVLPGDILIIDQNRRAKAGDIVIAQISDYSLGTAETVVRLYQTPFLISHSLRLGPQRPEQVDDDRVVIMGTCVGTIRNQH